MNPTRPCAICSRRTSRSGVAAVEACLREAPDRFPPNTDFRALAELTLSVMEGGVMQSRTFRDIAHFDRAVGQLQLHVGALARRSIPAN